MKYLNEESQFTRVSTDHANALMEAMGYEIEEVQVYDTHNNVYRSGEELFNLTEEIVEGDDDILYVRLNRFDETSIVQVDESGRETVIESINYDDEDFNLTGVFEDEDGLLYARMLSEDFYNEADDEDDDDDEEEE